MVVVVKESVSVTCSCEGGGSKRGVMGSRIGGNDGMRSGCSTCIRVCVRVEWVRDLLTRAGFALSGALNVLSSPSGVAEGSSSTSGVDAGVGGTRDLENC